ncbi:MAG: 7-cyano-7-deazaguanine synthase [Nitrospirae bacterium]|nr:7-cyano-7-deazaguanine synthase [Nitrospirota bacterium]
MGRIVVWSGGYDSTLLLTRELMENKSITAWSIIMPGISQEKLHSEHIVRERYKEFIAKKLPKAKIDHHEINIGYDFFRTSPGGSFPQQAFWALFASWFAHDGDEIIFGFHRGDEFWKFYEKAGYASEYICGIMDKQIKFLYPLKTTSKWQIVSQINRMGLRDYVWTCEGPPIPMSVCGTCDSCANLRQANAEIEYRIKKCKMKEPPIIIDESVSEEDVEEDSH